MLQVACSRCDRRGRYQLDNLIARHRADGRARHRPRADRRLPARDNAALRERCNMLFPDMLKLFPPR
jgi:hypothetical protein